MIWVVRIITVRDLEDARQKYVHPKTCPSFSTLPKRNIREEAMCYSDVTASVLITVVSESRRFVDEKD